MVICLLSHDILNIFKSFFCRSYYPLLLLAQPSPCRQAFPFHPHTEHPHQSTERSRSLLVPSPTPTVSRTTTPAPTSTRRRLRTSTELFRENTVLLFPTAAHRLSPITLITLTGTFITNNINLKTYNILFHARSNISVV